MDRFAHSVDSKVYKNEHGIYVLYDDAKNALLGALGQKAFYLDTYVRLILGDETVDKWLKQQVEDE